MFLVTQQVDAAELMHVEMEIVYPGVENWLCSEGLGFGAGL